jgi:phosphate starvation-inducible PhoH-like protein
MGMVNMPRQQRKLKPKREIKDKFMEERTTRTALQPKTKMQARYIEAITNFTQTISLGCAGTGKTYIASTMAAQLYMQGTINKIILTRPNVPSSRSLGSFPGTIEEKMAPWTTPVVEVLKNCMAGAYENAVRNGAIIVAPFETMRGSSFSDAFVIMDEAQNTTPEEMKMFTTRIGENCRIVINGDIAQSDIRQTSGLSTIIDLAQRFNLPVPVIEFGIDDVVRSKECKMWIEAFHKSQPKVAL